MNFVKAFGARLLISGGCTNYVSSSKPTNREIHQQSPCMSQVAVIDTSWTCPCNSRQPKAVATARYVMPTSHARMHKCVGPKAWLRSVPERPSFCPFLNSLGLLRPPVAQSSPTGEMSMDFLGPPENCLVDTARACPSLSPLGLTCLPAAQRANPLRTVTCTHHHLSTLPPSQITC